MAEKNQLDCIQGVYRDLTEQFGLEVAQKIYQNFSGLEVTFPKHFYTARYTQDLVIERYFAGESVKDLAREFEYSERYVRKLICEAKKKQNSNDDMVSMRKE